MDLEKATLLDCELTAHVTKNRQNASAYFFVGWCE
jgi:hypothetical protein